MGRRALPSTILRRLARGRSGRPLVRAALPQPWSGEAVMMVRRPGASGGETQHPGGTLMHTKTTIRITKPCARLAAFALNGGVAGGPGRAGLIRGVPDDAQIVRRVLALNQTGSSPRSSEGKLISTAVCNLRSHHVDDALSTEVRASCRRGTRGRGERTPGTVGPLESVRRRSGEGVRRSRGENEPGDALTIDADLIPAARSRVAAAARRSPHRGGGAPAGGGKRAARGMGAQAAEQQRPPSSRRSALGP